MKAKKHPGYPWEHWFSCKSVRLVYGKHFHCLPHGLAQQIRNRAGKEGRQVSIRITDGAVTVKNFRKNDA